MPRPCPGALFQETSRADSIFHLIVRNRPRRTMRHVLRICLHCPTPLVSHPAQASGGRSFSQHNVTARQAIVDNQGMRRDT